MPPRAPVAVAAKNQNGTPNTKGVLAVNPAALQQQQNTQQRNAPKQSSIRLKLEVRRLPPSLTKDEFLDAFGEEWKPMAGKVDWFAYRPGKTKSPGKVTEQSRAYVKLSNEAHVKPYETKFLSLTFNDAKGSHKDPAMKHLQPTLTFAPNQRIPATRQRTDGRQGTIDQDPEFIAFLESETQPMVKPPSLEAANAEKQKEKVTSTPLIDDLREKKANKAKAASAKPAKQVKEDKSSDKAASKTGKNAASESAKPAAKGDRAVKDSVKAPNKPAPKTNAASAVQTATSNSPLSTAPATTPRKRDRVTPNTIKSMLQRDLGIDTSPRRNGRAAASDTASATSQSPAPAPAPALTQPSVDAGAASASTTPGKIAKPARNPRKGPLNEKGNGQIASHDAEPASPSPNAILKKAPATQPSKLSEETETSNGPAGSTSASSSVTAPLPKPAKAASQPSAGSTKAYLKHANASQGITEALLVTALSTFGEVVKVDIDKRKGTALAEFKDYEGLRAAMVKRNIPVAQGAVEVLEFREKPASVGGRNTPVAPPRGGSMRGRGGRGGRGGASSPAVATIFAGAAASPSAQNSISHPTVETPTANTSVPATSSSGADAT